MSIVNDLDDGYYAQDFDPLGHELTELGDFKSPAEVDAVVERLATALEVVSAQLSTQVLENHDKFLEGIAAVTEVQFR